MGVKERAEIMTTSSKPCARASVDTLQELSERFGGAFAKAFAVFTAELALQVEGRDQRVAAGGNAASSVAAPPNAEPDDPLRDAPQWVRDAYERVKSGKAGPGLAFEDARAITLRNRLVFEIKRQGLTQAELAKRLGKSPAVLSRILRRPDRSKLTTLEQIAAKLGIDLHDLFAGLPAPDLTRRRDR
jgi:DNA-binding XRE family transcriptional regulator